MEVKLLSLSWTSLGICPFGGNRFPFGTLFLELQRGSNIRHLAAKLQARWVWATDCLLLLQKSLVVFQTTLNACNGFPETVEIQCGSFE